MNNSQSLTHFLDTVYRRRTALSVMLLAVIVISLLSTRVGAQSTCITSGPPSNSYNVTVCIDDPLFGDTISGSKNVITSTSITGQDPGVQKVIYYLDGAYLLTDFASDYSFVLPTDHFIDGPHTLEAEALMRDGYTSDRVAIDLTFGNGIIVPPVNTNTFIPYTGTPVAGQPFVVAATGDGAGGRPDAGAVSSLIASRNPDLFLYLGDVYELGTFTEFSNWYGSNGEYFDQFRDITNPTVGNHEMQDGAAPGYRYYWDNVDYYYSFDSAGWHIVNLTSIGSFDEYKPGTPQYEWLVQDLSSATAHCTAAYFHHPVFSVGPQGDTPRMDDIWSLLAQHGVDVVLTGHEHSYQRWERLDAAGNLDPQGIVQFVSGGGGHGIQSFVRTDSRLAAGYDTVPDAFGSLFLTLNPDGLSFEYVNIANDQLDFGVVPCSGAPQDTVPPSTPVLAGTVNGAGYPALDWTASVDNTAVESYEISRDGVAIGSVNGGIFSFVDTTALFGETYDYTVRAVDAGGNTSGESNVVSVMTGQSGTLVLNPEADAYVHQSNPSNNYGSSSTLYTDASPDIHSYLRFDIPSLPGVVESATLRVYANNSSSVGFTVHDIDNASWQENSITYNNAPAVTSQLASSGALVSGTYAEVDMTAIINGNSQLNIAMITSSTSNKSYSSSEGANPPELVIEVVDPNQPTPTPTATNTPTITPTPLNTPTPTPTAVPGTTVLAPVADTYVSAQSPTKNYGTNSNLRTDGAPDLRSYLRFDVPPLSGYLVSATLRVYANSNSSDGYYLHEVADDSWTELGTNYSNAPAVGNITGSSGAITSGSWTTVDVTPLINGGELLSLALSSTHARAISYSSREGTNPPELVIETSGTPPPTPTATPTQAPTATPTPVPPPTNTPTPTSIPTATSIPTSTPTPTATPIPAPGTFTFLATQDTYVNAGQFDRNYGNNKFLRTDASPEQRAYLRFDVQNLAGSIVSASLRVYAQSNSSDGYLVHGVADNTWLESTMTFSNAPALGPVVGGTGAFSANTWTEVDVTALVTGEGEISVALSGINNTAIKYSSKEGVFSAELIIVTQ